MNKKLIALGKEVLAISAKSRSFPQRELDEATAFCAGLGVEHEICISEELEIEGFRHNPANRCYLCKRELFTKMGAMAAEHGIDRKSVV